MCERMSEQAFDQDILVHPHDDDETARSDTGDDGAPSRMVATTLAFESVPEDEDMRKVLSTLVRDASINKDVALDLTDAHGRIHEQLLTAKHQLALVRAQHEVVVNDMRRDHARSIKHLQAELDATRSTLQQIQMSTVRKR